MAVVERVKNIWNRFIDDFAVWVLLGLAVLTLYWLRDQLAIPVWNHLKSDVILPAWIFWLPAIIIVILIYAFIKLVKQRTGGNPGNVIDEETQNKINEFMNNFNAISLKWRWITRLDDNGEFSIENIRIYCPECDLEVAPDISYHQPYPDSVSERHLFVKCHSCRRVHFDEIRENDEPQYIYDLGKSYIERGLRSL